MPLNAFIIITSTILIMISDTFHLELITDWSASDLKCISNCFLNLNKKFEIIIY